VHLCAGFSECGKKRRLLWLSDGFRVRHGDTLACAFTKQVPGVLDVRFAIRDSINPWPIGFNADLSDQRRPKCVDPLRRTTRRAAFTKCKTN
jgi:hypothetical protein